MNEMTGTQDKCIDAAIENHNVDSMSSCSNSDSDPGVDTLENKDFENIMSQECITSLKNQGLTEEEIKSIPTVYQ